MATKKRVKPLPRDYEIPKSFLAACEIDTKKGQQSYLFWKYVAEVFASAFHHHDDDACFDFISEAIERHRDTIRAAHPDLMDDDSENYWLFTDEEEEAAWAIIVANSKAKKLKP